MDGQYDVTAVEFDEVRKGYDPDQVETYIEKLGDKINRIAEELRKAVEIAEAAQARGAAALKERDAARARAEEAERNVGTPVGDDGMESMKKMLMLAQRTADSAVEEAQASAKNVVADARTKSAEIVADAEKRAERLLIEAQKVGDEMMQEKSAEIVATVGELEKRRDSLLSDTKALTKHLEEHRARMAEALRALGAADEDLVLEPLPELELSRSENTADGGGDTSGDAVGAAPKSPDASSDGPDRSSAPDKTAGAPQSGGAKPAPKGSTSAPVVEVGPPSGAVPSVAPERDASQPGGGEAPRASVLTAPLPGADRADDPNDVLSASRPLLFDAALEDADPVVELEVTRELSAVESESLLFDEDSLSSFDPDADQAMSSFFDDPQTGRDKRRFRGS